MDHLDEFDFFSVSAPYRAKFPKRKFKGNFFYILFYSSTHVVFHSAGIYLIVGGAALVYFLQTHHSSVKMLNLLIPSPNRF